MKTIIHHSTLITVFLLSSILSLLFSPPRASAGQITNVAIGTTPGDGTGDPLYVAFGKVNYNFYWSTNQWNYAVHTNGVFGGIVTGSSVTNSAITNSTFAGGLIDTAGSKGTSGCVPTANGSGGFAWATGGSSYPDISDSSLNVGINNGAKLSFNGGGSTMTVTPGANNFEGNSPNMLFSTSDGGIEFYADSSTAGGTVAPLAFISHSTDVNGISIVFEGDGGVYYQSGYFGIGTGTAFRIDSSGTVGGALWDDPGTLNLGIQQPSPAYVLDLGGSGQIGDSAAGNGNNIQLDNGSGQMIFADAIGISMDGGNITSDGGGNMTAQTFTPVSDRTLKQNITALDPVTALAMAITLTNYQWEFKGRTNQFQQIKQQRLTNSVTNARTHISTNTVTMRTSTNLVTRIIPASGRQFGPMAQDWHGVTGLDDGHHISLTAMNGLLLGAVQALADPTRIQVTPFVKLTPFTVTHSTNSTFGYGPGLLAVDGNNLYISVGTNAWRRISIPTNAW